MGLLNSYKQFKLRNILDILEKQKSVMVGWNTDFSLKLDYEFFKLRQELIDQINSYQRVKEEDSYNNVVIDYDDEDYALLLDTQDDLFVNLDNILFFEVNHDLVNTKKDKFFFLITSFFLFFNGFIFLFICYITIGFYSAFQPEADDPDSQNWDDLFIVEDLAKRAYVLQNIGKESSSISILAEKKYFNEEERLNNYNYFNYLIFAEEYNDDFLANKSKYNFNETFINSYIYILNLYYTILINNILLLISIGVYKTDWFLTNFYILKYIIYFEYYNSFYISTESKQKFFNVNKVTDWHYENFRKEFMLHLYK